MMTKALNLSPAQLRIAEAAFWLALASSFFLLPDKLTLMSQVMIFGLFAVSLDMALGYAGILTVGHAAFFGAGAYAAGLLAKYGWSEPFTGLLFALAVCGVLGYVLSYLVVRGADLLDSTARQIHLLGLLGQPVPAYAHLPLATNAAGEKLSKQTLARAIDAHPPQVALMAALRFLGHNPPDMLATAPLAETWAWARAHWSLAAVPRRRQAVADGFS